MADRYVTAWFELNFSLGTYSGDTILSSKKRNGAEALVIYDAIPAPVLK
jgi:hypothetical protein